MAIVTTDDKHYKDIANEIRTGFEMAYGQSAKDRSFKPEDMPLALSLIIQDGISNSYDQGKQAQYDAFWDACQDNGNRTNYTYGFCGHGWNDVNFKPKYPIMCSGSLSYVFRDSLITCTENPLQMDTSLVTSAVSAFYSSKLVNVGVLDLRNAANLNTIFQYCYDLTNIEKIILKSDGSQAFTNSFMSCNELKEIRFEGVIGQSGLSFQWSKKLSNASIRSIIGALSETTSGLSVTLSQTAVNNAFTTDEWSALEATKTNWAISLV